MAISYFCPSCGAENVAGETSCCACQQSLVLPPDFQGSGSSTLLNERYEILLEIGSGGFGAVYKARDTREHGRVVAVKQIHLKGLSSQEMIEATDAFNREAQILSTLSHPLLPRIFDRFSDPDHWYLVMNYIDGSTLDEYLHLQVVKALPIRAGLSLRETLAIALQLCDVLHYLHTQQPPVIFRDLKPGNIMRTTNGHLFLIDFGIARRFKPGQARDTIPFGSPGFAAPEQYGRAQTTPQADIYSLGALLFCLISGDDPSEHPFQFPPLRVYGSDGIRELDALIQRMIALDTAFRPTDIQEVQAELRHIQQLSHKATEQPRIWTPPQGQTPPPFSADGSGQQQIFLPSINVPSPARKTSRRRLLTSSLLLLGVIVAGGAVTALVSQQQSGMNVSLVSPNFGDSHPIANAQAPTYWSPDLSYAAVVQSDTNAIGIYRPQDQQPVHHILLPAHFSGPIVWWSPDNSKLAAQSDEGILYIWDRQSGQELSTSVLTNTSSTMLAWSPDGQYCALSIPDNTVIGNTLFILLQTSDGKQLFQKSIKNLSSDAVNSLAWSPDSRYVAFPTSWSYLDGTPWSLEIWDRVTQQKTKTLGGLLPSGTGTSDILSIAWSPTGKQIATVIGDAIWINQFGSQQPAKLLTQIGGNILTFGPVWSPDENFLATLLHQSLFIWNVASGKLVQLSDTSGPPKGLVALAWAADSKSVLVADMNNNLSRWPIV